MIPMKFIRPNGTERIKSFPVDKIDEYKSYGWIVLGDIQEPVEISAPYVVYRNDDGVDRVKHVTEQELPDKIATGWQQVIQDPSLPPAPITPETPLERLETAVHSVIDVSKKRKAGRSPKKHVR